MLLFHRAFSCSAISCLFLLLFLFGCSQNEINKAELSENLRRTSSAINHDFSLIREEVEKLASYTASLYEPSNQKKYLLEADRTKYVLSGSGVFYKPLNDGNSAVFVSGYFPVNEMIKEIVYFTEPLDSQFKSIIKKFPEVVQAYYNDRYAYNRIYPYFDVLAQYEPKMNIPAFNFYYLADKQHNPEKKAVWVKEPYVDPAGRGWMISAIAPVYSDGILVGVPGLDVTISTITDRYITTLDNAFIILDSNGIVVSINESLAGLFSLPQLQEHTYLETVKHDTYRAENFNLLNSRSKKIRKAINSIYYEGKQEVMFSKDGDNITILSEKIPELGWHILLVSKS